MFENKCDLIEKGEVLKEEGEKFAKDNNLCIFEYSALNNKNIQKPINNLIDIIISKNWKNLNSIFLSLD